MLEELEQRNILKDIGLYVDILRNPDTYGITDKGIWWAEFQIRRLHNQLPL